MDFALGNIGPLPVVLTVGGYGAYVKTNAVWKDRGATVPGATGAMRHVARGIPVLAINLPGLSGTPGPLKLRALASAMKPYDLILTYNWGAMNAVLAHSAFGPSLGLAGLIPHEDGFNSDEAGGLKATRNAYRILALARAQAVSD